MASLSAESITDTETRNRRLLDAKVAYENVIRSATTKTDSTLLFLTYVALARLYEYSGDDGYAIKLYETALKFGDATSNAYKEVIAARERLVKEQ
ncbi:MAG: hypothetical protein LC768_16960 [Acidobacteria bacterium]|nr:hypothetical protein [Acidobacteriota bacterium]